MKTIPLTQGKVALVDDADYARLAQYKWHAKKPSNGKSWYAARGKRGIKMHRDILGLPTSISIDHQDHNGLNNQRYNLRVGSQSMNRSNVGLQANNTSGFKGVHQRKSGRWAANLFWHEKGRRWQWLGTFDTPQEAARAFDAASLKRSAFAITNAGLGLL